MKLNWLGYYMQFDGYGRFNSRMSRALRMLGVQVKNCTLDHTYMPSWMLKEEGASWDNLTISCVPPYYLEPVPGRHWLYSMTEGSLIESKWVERINNSGVERVIVPCEHSAKAFTNSGVLAPVSVVPGGTDPEEFPVLKKDFHTPYTFLTLGDRGFRKGWDETREAFYIAFGGKTWGRQDVRLIIKSRKGEEDTLLSLMSEAQGADPRVVYQFDDAPNPYDVYARADCIVLPSRSEGWGMPHREAACMGLPVITQQYSGLEDGSLQEWALVLQNGELKPIPKSAAKELGEWMVPDIGEIAQWMEWCCRHPYMAKNVGQRAAQWIRNNQTWEHAAMKLLSLIEDESNAKSTNWFPVERPALSLVV